MFLATSNPARQLLSTCYIDEVQPDELVRSRADVQALVAGLAPGYRLLVNLSQLKSMSVECLTELGALMELFDQSGVGLVVRVIPDETKDIGLNILTVFHYPHHPQIITCQTMTEAARALGL
jgi:hypothetical protein